MEPIKLTTPKAQIYEQIEEIWTEEDIRETFGADPNCLVMKLLERCLQLEEQLRTIGFKQIETANIKPKEIYIPEELADSIIEGIKNFKPLTKSELEELSKTHKPDPSWYDE